MAQIAKDTEGCVQKPLEENVFNKIGVLTTLSVISEKGTRDGRK